MECWSFFDKRDLSEKIAEMTGRLQEKAALHRSARDETRHMKTPAIKTLLLSAALAASTAWVLAVTKRITGTYGGAAASACPALKFF